jgi:hypothetical protein
VPLDRNEKWLNVDAALRLGFRGLPAALSLAWLCHAQPAGVDALDADREPRPRRHAERDASIRRNRAGGMTQAARAAQYGLTHQRVSQILKRD